MKDCSNNIDLLFEASWEVCNKIGGIYTVLSSKAKTLHDIFKDKLIFIGPDVWSEENPSPYFTEVASLLRRWRETAVFPEGMSVRVGRWEIPGRPIAVLVKFDALYRDKDAFYGRMWELYGVDSLHAYGDYDEGMAFGRAAAMVIESLTAFLKADPAKEVAHFDEWTASSGLLTLKAEMPEAATVFTTHATSIGRSICGNGKPLYDYLRGYNGDQMAGELNMQSKHSLEKAAAHAADAFTTVSEITAQEAEQLLERRPVVTPNGFEMNFVPGRPRYGAARKRARADFLRVARALTGIDFDDETFILATSGRCEYRNKGIDMFLDAVRALDRGEKPGRRVLAFVLVPAWCGGPRADLSHALASGEHSRLADPMQTHNVVNYNEDPIVGRIHSAGFTNDADGRVCVIYVPCYLNGTDGIFDRTYYELLPGLDATVFASYYEPWGYTPLESIAFGVPTITTTLAGFGQWILATTPASFEACGVRVVERTDSNYAEATEAITRDLRTLIEMPAAEMKDVRAAASAEARRFLWTDFESYYDTAYCEAQASARARNKKK
ncbi:MAG: glycogen/starch synthase [Muribaculaceae bacterium]|nr:glycogen/starch synthase [Muribaculaceae bacterium]